MVTDSERVPRGKGEKNPHKGSETDLKSCAHITIAAARVAVAVCLLHNESASHAVPQG